MMWSGTGTSVFERDILKENKKEHLVTVFPATEPNSSLWHGQGQFKSETALPEEGVTVRKTPPVTRLPLVR